MYTEKNDFESKYNDNNNTEIIMFYNCHVNRVFLIEYNIGLKNVRLKQYYYNDYNNNTIQLIIFYTHCDFVSFSVFRHETYLKNDNYLSGQKNVRF